MSEEDWVDKQNGRSALEGMDMLGLSFHSLELSETFSKNESFQEALSEQVLERKEASKEKKLRLLRQAKEESSKSPRKEEVSKCSRIITLNEVAWHDTADSCWLVIYDYVYDCTEFLVSHPGGSDILLEYAGRDATLAFIGTGHSSSATTTLDRYLIGELPPGEKIFRVPGGLKIPGLSL